MFIRDVQIRGFRGLGQVSFSLRPRTVLVGENNSGKTSVLDAIRFALRSTPGRRTPPPDELDFALGADRSGPAVIAVTLHFEDSTDSPWPDEVVQELDRVALPDDRGLYSVRLHYTATLENGLVSESWDFLNAEEQPLTAIDRRDMLRKLQRFVPLYQLEALRDANDQFSSRGSLWSALLRGVSIPAEERAELEAQLRQLNQEVLSKAPRLAQAATIMGGLREVLPRADTQRVDVQALAFRLWDLLSRAQIVIGPDKLGDELPLRRHGQGAQGLAVFFLFKAYFEQLLEDREDYVQPLLTLEEPEAHLHPQAARSLWGKIMELTGQALVTTHSPYFVQNVPLESLRIVHKDASKVRVTGVETSCSVVVTPGHAKLEALSNDELEYDAATGELTARRPLGNADFERLRKKDPHNAKLYRELLERSASILDRDQKRQLESAARLLRGEMFFARAWLLCEGESDRLVLRMLFQALGIDPDPAGVSIIDFKVGSAGQQAFGSLARILGYPVFLFCDGDSAGQDYQRTFLAAAQVSPEHVFVANPALEGYLLASEAGPLLVEVVCRLGGQPTDSPEKMADTLHDSATKFPVYLSELLAERDLSLPVPADLADFLQRVTKSARG